MAGAGTNGTQKAAIPYALILEKEHEIVLRALAKLREKPLGELKIAMRKNPKTRLAQLVYVGVHEKEDLEEISDLYKQAESGVTF